MPPERTIDNDRVVERLAPTSTITERLSALMDAGIPSKILADTVGVSPNTVWNWANMEHEPSARNSRRIDDIRFVAFALMTQAELEPEAAAQWLTSRSPLPPHHTPLEEIRENPESVIELMCAAVEEHRR